MEKLEKSKIFLDYDGCIVNTIKCICSLYNEDFKGFEMEANRIVYNNYDANINDVVNKVLSFYEGK